MAVEALNNSNEYLFQESLQKLKNQINKPGQVNYIKESKDKKYDIYSYKLVQGGTRGGVKNKYEQQIGKWIEGTQFTDVNGNEIKKERFEAGEVVYLRVPKTKTNKEKKENNNIPGKVEYLGNKKDKENRNRKVYSYTFAEGGNLYGLMNKFKSQIRGGKDVNAYPARFSYYDKNGNSLKKEWFGKGETIYFKEPNMDIIDPTPEMTMNDIMKISDNDIQQLYSYRANLGMSDSPYQYIEHFDKKGKYTIVNNKKIYHHYRIGNPEGTPILYEYAQESQSNLRYVSIAIKKGKKLQGIYCDGDGKAYRGELEIHDGWYIEPKGGLEKRLKQAYNI